MCFIQDTELKMYNEKKVLPYCYLSDPQFWSPEAITVNQSPGSPFTDTCTCTGAAAARAQEVREELLHVQGQEGRPWEGKEQRLRFAGAAVKGYPTSKVRETQVRR